ncbi:hypothetical protein B23_3483 [Geobacillus thermoleovorans B23]|nr:hypothetical protein B23_3483 [Geobacillus thermoleovorans B23]
MRNRKENHENFMQTVQFSYYTKSATAWFPPEARWNLL